MENAQLILGSINKIKIVMRYYYIRMTKKRQNDNRNVGLDAEQLNTQTFLVSIHNIPPL